MHQYQHQPMSRFNVVPQTLRHHRKDGGVVAVLEPVLCLKRFRVDGGIVARLVPANCK